MTTIRLSSPRLQGACRLQWPLPQRCHLQWLAHTHIEGAFSQVEFRALRSPLPFLSSPYAITAAVVDFTAIAKRQGMKATRQGRLFQALVTSTAKHQGLQANRQGRLLQALVTSTSSKSALVQSLRQWELHPALRHHL